MLRSRLSWLQVPRCKILIPLNPWNLSDIYLSASKTLGTLLPKFFFWGPERTLILFNSTLEDYLAQESLKIVIYNRSFQSTPKLLIPISLQVLQSLPASVMYFHQFVQSLLLSLLFLLICIIQDLLCLTYQLFGQIPQMIRALPIHGDTSILNPRPID